MLQGHFGGDRGRVRQCVDRSKRDIHITMHVMDGLELYSTHQDGVTDSLTGGIVQQTKGDLVSWLLLSLYPASRDTCMCVMWSLILCRPSQKAATDRFVEWLTTLVVERESADARAGPGRKARVVLCGHSYVTPFPRWSVRQAS